MRRILLLLIGVGLALWLIIVNVDAVALVRALPADLDLMVVFIGLIVSLIAMTALAFQRGLERLRKNSIDRARREAFAEHHRFLRRLDHELKNPLTAILAGVGNLRETCEGKDQEQALTSMELQALRLSRIVTDLRKLAEIETLSLEETTINLKDLLEETMALAQDRSVQDHRRLSLILPQPRHALPSVVGDRDLILLALHNLIDNAFKFTCTDDSVEIRAFREGNCAVIQVHDTGFGILKSDIPLVWEELYRGQNADDVSGSGIGLTLVSTIVKRLRGDVRLDSQPGKGTTVTIRLPVLASH